jgi:hypothetical protein
MLERKPELHGTRQNEWNDRKASALQTFIVLKPLERVWVRVVVSNPHIHIHSDPLLFLDTRTLSAA